MLTSSWLIAAPGGRLKRNPLAVRVDGVDMVLFRDEAGRARALADRCPHRSVPLSLGRCHRGRLACAYHGWEFDGDGACRHIPSNIAPVVPRKMLASYAASERDGYVWVRLDETGPETPPGLWLAGHARRQWTVTFERAADDVAVDLLLGAGLPAGAGPVVVDGPDSRLIFHAPARFELHRQAVTGERLHHVAHLVPESPDRCRLEVTEGSSRRGRLTVLDSGPCPFVLASTGADRGVREAFAEWVERRVARAGEQVR